MGKATGTADALTARSLSAAEAAAQDAADNINEDVDIMPDGRVVRPGTLTSPPVEVIRSDLKPWD